MSEVTGRDVRGTDFPRVSGWNVAEHKTSVMSMWMGTELLDDWRECGAELAEACELIVGAAANTFCHSGILWKFSFHSAGSRFEL